MEGLGAAAVRDDKVAAVLGVDVGALQRYRPSAKSVAFSVFSQSLSTGLPAYSDSAGKLKKCHCKRLSLYPMIFSKRRAFL